MDCRCYRLESLVNRGGAIGIVPDLLSAAVITLDTVELQAFPASNKLSEIGGFLSGENTAAVLADIHLDKDADFHAESFRSFSEPLNTRLTVHADPNFGVLGKCSHTSELSRIHDLIRDQNVLNAACDHRLGFGDLLAALPDRSAAQLGTSHHWAFVRLGMRA